MTIKTGMRIEVRGFGLDNQERWESARIGRVQKFMLPMPVGYHPVTFDADGARLLVHESGFRIMINA